MNSVATDLEGTLTAGQGWAGLTNYLKAHGQSWRVNGLFLQLAPRILLWRLKLIPDRAFKEKAILRILYLFKGMTEAELLEMGEWVVEHELWPKRRLPLVAELEAHQANGRSVFIASGVFEPILTAFAKRLGVQGIGTPLKMVNGRFTGYTLTPFNVGQRKAETLQPHLPLHTAYGDTIQDVPMLQLAQNPVVVHPAPDLAKVAQQHGWRVLQS